MAYGRSIRAGVVALALATGCMPQDFLYFQPLLGPDRVSATYSIKEVLGTSSLDIIWAVDNSGSMDDDQQNLILNSDLFIKELAKQNSFRWKIGMVSTHREDTPFLGFKPAPMLDSSTPNPAAVFNAAVSRLTTNWGEPEESLAPILIKLEAEPGFVSGSPLAVIIVTDSEEESPFPVSHFISEIRRRKGDDNFFVYAVLAFEEFGCPGEGEIEWDRSRYKELLDLRKGKLFSLCDPAFGSNLAAIGQDLATRIARPRIVLDHRPESASILVSHQGRMLPGGPQEAGGYWYYDFEGNSVVFYDLKFAPADTESVTVSYIRAG